MTEPTDDEILDEARAAGIDWHKHWNDDGTNRLEIFTHAILDRWGQPDGEHTNAELQQMLVECYEGKKKCYFAIGQHQTAIDNLIKERDALIKSASGYGAQLVDENGRQALSYWPYCSKCRKPFEFEKDEPFASCGCPGSTEWGDPRPASWVQPPAPNGRLESAPLNMFKALTMYDPKALLEVFQKAQAGSSGTAGTLRGIAAVIASWESRAEPHTWLIASPQPVVREPLPVIELMRIVMDVEQQHHFLRGTTNWASAVGRAVERAHGIKGGQHGTE